MTRYRFRHRWLPATILFLAACAREEAPPAPAPGEEAPAAAEEAAYTVEAVANGGAIAGAVTFTGTPPAAETIEVTKDQATCGTEKVAETLKVGAGGALAYVVVWIDGITKGKAWPDGDGTVDQKDCHYVPHVGAMAAGRTLEIINSDPVLHNIHAYVDGDTLFNIAQPTQGQKTPKKIKQAGPVELKCDVHSWMHAWVFVASHPYYAVTGEDGKYSLGDVPPGTYKVKAWHESLGQKEAEVTVAAGGTASADFSFAPAM